MQAEKWKLLAFSLFFQAGSYKIYSKSENIREGADDAENISITANKIQQAGTPSDSGSVRKKAGFLKNHPSFASVRNNSETVDSWR